MQDGTVNYQNDLERGNVSCKRTIYMSEFWVLKEMEMPHLSLNKKKTNVEHTIFKGLRQKDQEQSGSHKINTSIKK